MPTDSAYTHNSENRDARRAAIAMEKGKGEPEHVLPPDRFLRLPDVTAMTGLCTSHLYEMMREKQFPQNIPLSERVVVWSEREVQAWQKAKLAARNDVEDRKASKQAKKRRNKNAK